MFNFGNQQQNEYRQAVTGFTDLEGAKQIARRIFETYDRDRNGIIDNVETVPMIVDAYKSFNRVFAPSRGDIESYSKVMDKNGDGKVTYQDIEELCIKYLCPNQQATHFRPEKQVNKTKFPAEIEQRLEVARRLFKQFDQDDSGYLDVNEIASLIAESYKQMGMQSYQPTKDDVQSWLQMSDQNEDGRVTLQEYEQLVLRSLRAAGYKLEGNYQF